MPVGEQKTSFAVVKGRRRPICRRMATGTVRKRKRRSGSLVCGIRGLPPGVQMASRIPAIGWDDRQIVVVIGMAGSAGHVGMP